MMLLAPDRSNTSPAVNSSRRQFLSRAAAAVSTVALTAPAATEALAYTPDRRLNLINDHTWERLDITYFTRGMYIDESLQAINYLMRDHRANVSTTMDPQLLDNLHRLMSLFDTREPLHILSGYRTPETNARLRQRSKGVAKYSLHMEGRAADIYVPGIDIRFIRAAALSLNAGGVGYYSRSGFVHMDTGLVRDWAR